MIGIDFGTTHTTAAFYDGTALHMVPLDTAQQAPALLRSMLYIDRQHRVRLGRDAVRRYLDENTGRPVQYERKHIGVIRNLFSTIEGQLPLDMEREIYIDEDVAAPGRLIQSIKRALRDPTYEGTVIFDRYYTLQALIAPILAHVRARAEHFLGRPVRRAVLGRPVRFAEDPAADQQAEHRLREAATLAGFQEIRYVQEPVAAAYAYGDDYSAGRSILVFDFGGGTLDLTIMCREPGGPLRAVATHGILIGGDDLDRAIMRERVAPRLGVRAAINRSGQPFPRHLATMLERLATLPQLAKHEHLMVIREAQAFSPTPDAFHALERLVTKNYGFELFERIEAAKRDLSSGMQAVIELPAIDLSESLTRNAFAGDISNELARTRRAIDELLARAGMDEEAIDVVVTTGGSAQIPVFQRMLQRRFAASRLARSDSFGTVVAGLARHAHVVGHASSG